jgi:hypothetical protein
MITIDDLVRLSDVVKIKKICEDCGINYSTIMAKIQRKTELSIKESNLIQKTLLGYGLNFFDVSQSSAEKIKNQKEYEDM